MALMTDPFAPTGAIRRGVRCYWHPDDDEPSDEVAYWACGECFHAWRTRAEFDSSVYTLEKELRRSFDRRVRFNPRTMAYCPLCAHDW